VAHWLQRENGYLHSIFAADDWIDAGFMPRKLVAEVARERRYPIDARTWEADEKGRTDIEIE
jgi:hypothetical protein